MNANKERKPAMGQKIRDNLQTILNAITLAVTVGGWIWFASAVNTTVNTHTEQIHELRTTVGEITPRLTQVETRVDMHLGSKPN